METIFGLLRRLDSRTIAARISAPIDKAREHYPLAAKLRRLGSEEAVITDYYQYLIRSRCGASFDLQEPAQAAMEARELLNDAYRRRNGNVFCAIYDAENGINGGLPGVIDVLTEAFKNWLIRSHIDSVLHIRGEDRIELLRQFFTYFGSDLPASTRLDEPELYSQADVFRNIILSYVRGREQVIRRLNQY